MNTHLNEDQLIRCIVDENDIDESLRAHLHKCPACKEQKQQIEEQLTCLARMANKMMNDECRMMKEKEFHHSSFIIHHSSFPSFVIRHSFLAAGFALIILVFGIWWTLQYTISNKQMTDKFITEIQNDNVFITEVNMLEESGLNDFYTAISDESESYFGDEFLEFVVPLVNNNNSA